MNRGSKWERKFGKFAIKHLTLYIITAYAIGYLLQMMNQNVLYMLTLDVNQILQGEVWRVVTWLLVPPSSFDFFTLLMLYVYYNIGTTLEIVWGTWKYNVYIVRGILITVAAAFLYLGFEALFGLGTSAENLTILSMNASFYFSTYYVNLSILLGYAMTFPERQMLLMFVFPIKIKVLGIIYALLLGYTFLVGGSVEKFVIGASLLNIAIFFFMNNRKFSPKQVMRQQKHTSQVKKVEKANAIHKCHVCGRTNSTNPELEFRYCSKCNGNYEYCQEHLFTHEHVK